MSSRITRSRSGNTPGPEIAKFTPRPSPSPSPPAMLLKHKTSRLAARRIESQALSKEIQKLAKKDRALLQLKKTKLQAPDAQLPLFIEGCLDPSSGNPSCLGQAAAATLVFAGESAGTAVCISPDGLLLTCSHCIAETREEYESDNGRWLLFASGDAVKAKCISWDPVRDLALLQIIVATSAESAFPYTRLSTKPPRRGTHLLCIGHPGSEDFEAETPGMATGYDVLHISEGRFRGMAKDQDPQDNSDIGALMHDCWTYWGHSGAPLLEKASGTLVGLHSSWDDETGMRRGVGWAALRDFLDAETDRIYAIENED